ncbi:TPA: hypothetical protein ACGO8N_001877 [Streptococcus suis]
MDQVYFDELLRCLKILKNNSLEFPELGTQNKHGVYKQDDASEQFELVINRKGHLNKSNLTYLMRSKSLNGILVRLDCNGTPHNDVPTPHIHIFDEEHDFGRIAIGLEDIEADLAHDLMESLIYFLDYNNVHHVGINIPML